MMHPRQVQTTNQHLHQLNTTPHPPGTDVEAHLCGFYISASLLYCPPMPPHQPHCIRGTGSAKTHRWPTTTTRFLGPCNPLARVHHLGRTKTTPTPPLPWDFNEKKQKCCWHRQNALQRFLATSVMIGHITAPDFNGVHPQGVQSDSLGSFKLLADMKAGETLVLHAFFECAASTTVLYILYIIEP
jgi:hypothetical protein